MKFTQLIRNVSLLGARLRAAPAPVKGDDELLSSLLTMAWFVEARDPYTGGHLWRVAQFCELLAEKTGFDSAEVARIALGGFVHDLGKIGIPDAVLRKPGPLSDDEYAVIKTHPDIGYRMLEAHPLASLVSDAVWMHHETPDGRGYPKGLRGTEISAMAAITGICDAFDAMTSSRPYRAGMPQEKALGIIGKNLGKQFDAHYGELFIQLGEAGRLTPVIGHTDHGIPLHICQMCGPTVVVRQLNTVGDHVFCPSCGTDYELQKAPNEAAFQLVSTGRVGTAQDLSPAPDLQLIADLAHRTAQQIRLPDAAKVR